MATKYLTYYRNMLNNHEKLFSDFKKIHEKFNKNSNENKDEFNKLGTEVLSVINKTENKLCLQSEKTQYAKYSEKLAEKFWNVVRKEFPLIDKVDNTITSNKPDLDSVLDDLF